MDFKKDIYLDPDIKKYVKIISRDPRAFASLANALLVKGYVEEAIQICEEGLLDDPEFVAGRAVLGKCYVKDGKIGKAKDEFEKIIEKNNENVVALKGLGEIYYSMELYTDAMEMYEHLLFIDPMNSEFQDMVENIKELIPETNEQTDKIKFSDTGENTASADSEVPEYVEQHIVSEQQQPIYAKDIPDNGEFIDEKEVFAVINLLKRVTNFSERVLASGYNSKSQKLFSDLYSVINPKAIETIVNDFESYLDLEGNEGDIIPIERGVSPHSGESIEIAGTENIGLQKTDPGVLEEKVESYGNIVSNEEISFREDLTPKGPAVDEDLEQMINAEVGDHKIDQQLEQNNRILAEGPEEIPEIPRSPFKADVNELDTTLKGKNAFDMEMQTDKATIPVNEIPNETTETVNVPYAPENIDSMDTDIEDFEEEIIEDEIIENDEMTDEDNGTNRVPFRDDSYMSLENQISQPQDLTELMAEAEKSIPKTGNVPSDSNMESFEEDIMDELESESAAYLEEKDNDQFGGEHVLDINEQSQMQEPSDLDKFQGHAEVEVGEVGTVEKSKNHFGGNDEIDVNGNPPEVFDEAFAGNDEIDVPDKIEEIPFTAEITEEKENGSFGGGKELDMQELELNTNGKAKENDLFDADDEAIDDIGKWLNEL